jgi:hypothetical protein
LLAIRADLTNLLGSSFFAQDGHTTPAILIGIAGFDLRIQ